jgi:hypothetical protein
MGRVPDRSFGEIGRETQMFRDMKHLEQRSIVLDLAIKRLSPLAIRGDLMATLGVEAVSDLSVAIYLPDAVFTSSDPPAPLSQPKPHLDDCDHAILLLLADQPLALVRMVSRLTHLRRTTIHMGLMTSLGFHLPHLRWVSHRLSRFDKLDCVAVFPQFLSGLAR